MKLRSFVFVMALAAGLPAAAQTPATPPAQTPATTGAQTPATTATAPPPAVPHSRLFTADAGIMFTIVKPDKVADFEAVMARVKEALAKSTDAKRKQQALAWDVYKGVETASGGGVVYIWFIKPPVKDLEYTITDILKDGFPSEAQDLWAKYSAAIIGGQTMLNLTQVLSMSPVPIPK